MTDTIFIAIYSFTTNIVAQSIVLGRRCTIAGENHHIVLVELGCIQRIDLASLYGSNRLCHRLAFCDREHMVEMFTLVVLGLSVQEEHQLILVIIIKELLGYQRIDLCLIDSNHRRIQLQ